jgi:hypothetical protein
MKYTRENIIEGIDAKLNQVFGQCPATRPLEDVYKEVLRNYPAELEQNILEWINGETISEINYHGISVREVMDDLSLEDCQIPRLFKNFIIYRNYNFVDKMLCYRGL